MEFRPLATRGPYLAEMIDGPGDDLVISFSSIGHDPTRPPSPEFAATACGRGPQGPTRRAIFIRDAERTWANAPGFEEILSTSLAAARSIAPVTRIALVGLSMGGFQALVAAHLIRADATLAFCPQYSVAPDWLRPEDSWAGWAGRLGALRWPAPPLPRHGWTCIAHGTRDDLHHARAFPPQPGTDHLLFAGHGHSDLVPWLKSRGSLGGLIEAALTDDRRRFLRIAASAGGERIRPGASI